ncbi:hypothetical protein [Acinetobacter courvalinii]|uniref:hypothetical protein n=1 Tax=Acinetobacter courvalinii TaxID=280147 RepID=UPI00289A1C9C|nr:hypothetical protein [Acinetobacter courvalinii]
MIEVYDHVEVLTYYVNTSDLLWIKKQFSGGTATVENYLVTFKYKTGDELILNLTNTQLVKIIDKINPVE